jgi:hypothetical protein
MKIPAIPFVAASILSAPTSAAADDAMWVAAGDGAGRHTCPSIECGVVGRLLYREGATVLEVKNGWGRVSRHYNASCVGGRSEYVDHGRSDCVPENGIENGRFAEWVQLNQLSAQRPADPGAGATGVAKLVAQSDDFHLYEAEFVSAAEALIASGDCNPRDFTDMGGWLKATNKPGIYFTYCGSGSDRIYLNVSSGQTFR